MDIPPRGDDSIFRHDPVVAQVDVEARVFKPDRTLNLGGWKYYPLEKLTILQREETHVGMFCRMAGLRPTDRVPRLYLCAEDREPVSEALRAGEGRGDSVIGGTEIWETSNIEHRTSNIERPENFHPISWPYATIASGTKGDVRKTWPMDRYIEIARRLLARGITPVWVGDVSGDPRPPATGAAAPPAVAFHDEDRKREARRMVPGLGVDLRGQTTARQSFAWIEKASVHIGNPDGLSLAAMALRRPTVIPWGNLCDPNRFWIGDPDRTRLLETRGLECDHCHTLDFVRSLKECCRHPVEKGFCIKDISVERVWREVEQMLNKC